MRPDVAVPRQRIALDYGQVSMVMRAHGPDITGTVETTCADLLASAKDDEVVMSETFFNTAVSELGARAREMAVRRPDPAATSTLWVLRIDEGSTFWSEEH